MQRAHAYKGAAANLGIRSLADTALAMEIVSGALALKEGNAGMLRKVKRPILSAPTGVSPCGGESGLGSTRTWGVLPFVLPRALHVRQEMDLVAEKCDATGLKERLDLYDTVLLRMTDVIGKWCAFVIFVPRGVFIRVPGHRRHVPCARLVPHVRLARCDTRRRRPSSAGWRSMGCR